MTDPKTAAAWRAIRYLRANPSLIDSVRPVLERVAKVLNAVDVDALTDDERAGWIDTARQLLSLAEFVDAIDEPEAVSIRRMLGELSDTGKVS